MALVYDDTSVRSNFTPGEPISQWDTNRVMGAWLVHVKNRLYLTFMATHGNFSERQMAHKELTICRRKTDFWEKHLEFDKDKSATLLADARKDWASGRGRR